LSGFVGMGKGMFNQAVNGSSFGDLFLSPVTGLRHFPLLPGGLGPGL